MADPKKMSVADILAAARKKDSQGGDAPAARPEPAAEAAAPAEASAPEAAAPVEKPKPKPAPAGKMSVAEMLAAARGEKPGAAAAPAAKPAAPKSEAPAKTPISAEAKPAAAKPAAKKAEAAAGTVDTSSILAAARTAARPGPVSKSEAVAKVAEPAVKPAKEKIVAPPMPAKPVYAQPRAAADEDRRSFLAVMLGTAMGLGFASMAVVGGLWSLALARFMFPNVLTEPPSRFKVGFPSNFPPGSVDEKFKAQFGVWVVNAEYNGQPQIVALKSVCTHLGCTPNWLDGEQKFKCPCHGSGFYKDGINFEGPAPRPLERYAIRLADDGQLEVDKSKLFQEELGQWSDAACFVPV